MAGKRGSYKVGVLPKCDRCDCRANLDGDCVALNDNDFGNRECPFYKEKADEFDRSWASSNLRRK